MSSTKASASNWGADNLDNKMTAINFTGVLLIASCTNGLTF